MDAGYSGGFAKFSTLALDRLIGAPITQAIIEGNLGAQAMPASAGMSHLPAPPPRKRQKRCPVRQTPSRLSSRWEHKHTKDKVVTVVDITGGKVELHSGETFLSYLLTRDYQRVH